MVLVVFSALLLALVTPVFAQFSANSDSGYSTFSYPIEDGVLKLRIEMVGAKAGRGANDGSGVGGPGGQSGRVSGILVVPSGIKNLMLGGALGEIGSDGANGSGTAGGSGGRVLPVRPPL